MPSTMDTEKTLTGFLDVQGIQIGTNALGKG